MRKHLFGMFDEFRKRKNALSEQEVEHVRRLYGDGQVNSIVMNIDYEDNFFEDDDYIILKYSVDLAEGDDALLERYISMKYDGCSIHRDHRIYDNHKVYQYTIRMERGDVKNVGE